MKQPASVCILDYGSGNVRSVQNIISYLGYEVFVSNDSGRIREATHLILPGVGAFGAAMKLIHERIPLDIIESEVFSRKKPFLGICVGMQVFADRGHEYGVHSGLGWVHGEVVRVRADTLSLPHIGWNDIRVLAEDPLFKGLGGQQDFYFVHSYAFIAEDPAVISSEVTYGSRFCSSIQRDNIFGVQFHPEKSQKAGQLLFKNFLAIR